MCVHPSGHHKPFGENDRWQSVKSATQKTTNNLTGLKSNQLKTHFEYTHTSFSFFFECPTVDDGKKLDSIAYPPHANEDTPNANQSMCVQRPAVVIIGRIAF